MQTFLVAVLIVNLWVSQIEGLPYYGMRRTESGTVAESMKKEAKIEALREADQMPLMETARLMRNINPSASESLVEVVGQSAQVRRAAAEGAAKKAVEMGVVQKSDEAKLTIALMNSTMVEKAATEAAARMAEEPLSTGALIESLPKRSSESGLRKRLVEDKKRTGDGLMTKRESEVIKKVVEQTVQVQAEEILANATEGKPLRHDEVKPAIQALKNSDKLQEVAEEAAAIAARRMNVPFTNSRNGLRQIKRSQLVRQAVEEGVLRAVDDFQQIETQSPLSQLLTEENTMASFDLETTDGSVTQRDSEVIKNVVEKVVKAQAEDILIDATEGKPLQPDEVKPAIEALKNSEEIQQVAEEAAVIAARRMNLPFTNSRSGLRQIKRSQLVRQAVEDGVLGAVDDFPQTEENTSPFHREKTDGSLTKRDSEVIKNAVEKVVKAQAEDILIDATEGQGLQPDEVKPAIEALKNSDEIQEVAEEAAAIAARRMKTSYKRSGMEQVTPSKVVRQAVDEGILRAVEGLQQDTPPSSNRILTLSMIDESLRLDTIHKAVMGAVMDMAGRLGSMQKATQTNSEEAAEIVRTTANKPIVRLAAARRAMEIAVDNGIIDETSATPQILRDVANLPSIRKIAAMGAVKKAVEMGVTA